MKMGAVFVRRSKFLGLGTVEGTFSVCVCNVKSDVPASAMSRCLMSNVLDVSPSNLH